MSRTKYCPLCKTQQSTMIYRVENIPVFQNKVYQSVEKAKRSPTAEVLLVSCDSCRFVYNSAFDPAQMPYDEHYENEQAHSEFFQHYLSSIVELFTHKSFTNKKMIEIGCGKGFFLEKLARQGFDITGFDPAYTGENPCIIKDYFNYKYANLSAEVIILRHVLEHIPDPFEFLHAIGSAVNYNAQIYIEVPSLEWIINHAAFWDIFYEHCNYFTLATLSGLFNKSDSGFLFNHQYLYLIADLNNLKKINSPIYSDTTTNHLCTLTDLIYQYRKALNKRPGAIVWGAGAKGVTFSNLVDPDSKLISCLVDINPKKQDKYIAKTGHKIISPRMLAHGPIQDILVMNDNYYDEIQKITLTNFNLVKLSEMF